MTFSCSQTIPSFLDFQKVASLFLCACMQKPSLVGNVAKPAKKRKQIDIATQKCEKCHAELAYGNDVYILEASLMYNIKYIQ